jgi:hypothetical protein
MSQSDAVIAGSDPNGLAAAKRPESRRCDMAQQRFALDWDRPSLPDASTHVTLFDGGKDPLHVVASGHAAGDANALSDLLTSLRERNESADAIGYVSEAYAALTGTVLARSRS